MFEVYTFKEPGLLASFAHDLCLEGTPRVSFSGAQVTVRVAIASLRVRGQVRSGAVTPLSSRDHDDIQATLCAKVLDAPRHPEALYIGEVGADAVEGALTLLGRTLPLRLPFSGRGGEATGEVELAPSRWGVVPYQALLGQLRLQDRVRVRYSWPLPG